jgi:hypothetical protein
MVDNSPREKARKDLRDYDNPKSGKNPNYQNAAYLKTIEAKWGKSEAELRAWMNERRHMKQHKWS